MTALRAYLRWARWSLYARWLRWRESPHDRWRRLGAAARDTEDPERSDRLGDGL